MRTPLLGVSCFCIYEEMKEHDNSKRNSISLKNPWCPQEKSNMATGSCLCGAVNYEYKGSPMVTTVRLLLPNAPIPVLALQALTSCFPRPLPIRREVTDARPNRSAIAPTARNGPAAPSPPPSRSRAPTSALPRAKMPSRATNRGAIRAR